MLLNHSFAPYSILSDRISFIPITRTLTDLDGNEYHVIVIDGREWIMENFRCTKYADESMIPNIVEGITLDLYSDSWGNGTVNAYDTFVSSGLDVSASSDGQIPAICEANTISLTNIGLLKFNYTLSLISGTSPIFTIKNDVGTILYSDSLIVGTNLISFYITASDLGDYLTLEIINRNEIDQIPFATNFELSNVTCMYEGWSGDSNGAYCVYDNDLNNIETYGLLYNWFAVNNDLGYLMYNGVRELGWNVPTLNESKDLIDYYGGNSIAGASLKESGTNHWEPPNTGATNISKFTALPGGFRDELGYFNNIKFDGRYWTSTEYDIDNDYAWHRGFKYSDNGAYENEQLKNNGFSVRLTRTIPEGEILTDDNGNFLTDDNFNLINLE